ncbi:MAG: molybdopterin-dependent oxidoreductase, partial [Gammaproteobacteria bacterium]|nr:molybdopterin-dependent oxidoreductase [Gammaproteobacteria bacterium]
MSANISRREFLRMSATATGGMLVTISLPSCSGKGTTEVATAAASQFDGLAPWGFVRIEADTVTIGARGAEIGQGIKTSLPMLIAEEMDIPWSMVTVEQLDYGIAAADNESGLAYPYGAQGAGGSTSIPGSWTELREVGARIRQLLLQAAANYWDTEPAMLTTADGMVIHPDGQSVSYFELAQPASAIPVPTEATLKDSSEFRVIGQPTRVADCEEIVTGNAFYGIDADMPGAGVAVVARCPYFEGSIESFDDTAARALPGVRTVVELPAVDAGSGLETTLAAGIAVVADNTWAALKGRDALEIKWRRGRWGKDSTQALEQRAVEALAGRGVDARVDGDFAAARERARRVVEAEYAMPFLSHATLEPQNATIALEKDRALLIASTQSPSGASRMINRMTGIPRPAIEIRIPRSGGGFGRRLESDFVAEAVLIAQATGTPIKLMWTRDDDLQHDWYRPCGLHQLAASLNDDNQLTGWLHRAAATDRRFGLPGFAEAPAWIACLDPDAIPAGCVTNYHAEFVPLEFGLARGWWRGPLPSFVAFANQSFMDEVAHAAGREPLEFQLAVLGEAREMDYEGHG